MINDCHKCGKPPTQAGMISCSNNDCSEFGEKHFIWDWQKIKGDLDTLKDVEQEFIDGD